MVIVEEGDSVSSLSKTLSRDENSALPEREGGGAGEEGSGQSWLAAGHEGRRI